MENKIKEVLEKFKNHADEKKINDFIGILSDMGLKDEHKLSGLLYYCLRFKLTTIEDIQTNYSENIVNIITILEKIRNINYSQQESEAENLRKMFFAITKDIRIIMTKLAFVLADLRHEFNDTPERQLKLANSIFLLYAPLAARLGLSAIKTELEEGAFKIKYPEKFDYIEQEVEKRFNARQPVLEKLLNLVETCLKDLNIQGKVYGRKKHTYSIYKKTLDHSFDDIYDLVAVRAIVKTVAECYALLGRLQTIVEPYKDRFKDYISQPKPNGYQSLHTTVLIDGFPVEIQIRTEEMHQYAEYGVAAHWLYKERKNKQDTLDLRLAWLRQMMENENISIDDLASSLNQDIYNSEIFVQTPKGKVIYLPNGATPIDFAYCIHSEVGNKYTGAKVNGKMVSTNTELKNGDVVEIITNPNSKGPSKDWLKIVKTSEARSKINSFFKKNIKEDTLKIGKSMMESAIKEKGYSVSKLVSKGLDEILKFYNFEESEDLYLNIGTNAISAKVVANKLAHIYQKQLKEEQVITPTNNTISLAAPNEKQIMLQGLNNVLLKFANCCHPIYGDEIIGFISAGRGVIIHRKQCPNVSYFRQSRLIDAWWKPIADTEKKKNKK